MGGGWPVDFEEFYNELFADFKAVQNGHVYSSRRGFAQRTADLADVILEMNEIL